MNITKRKRQIFISLALGILLTVSGGYWMYFRHLHQERIALFLSIKENCDSVDISFYDGKSIGLVVDDIGFAGGLGSYFGNLDTPLWGERLSLKLEKKLVPIYILRCWNKDSSLYVDLNLNIIYAKYGTDMLAALKPAIFYFGGNSYVVTVGKQIYTIQDKEFFPELLVYLSENGCPGIGLK